MSKFAPPLFFDLLLFSASSAKGKTEISSAEIIARNQLHQSLGVVLCSGITKRENLKEMKLTELIILR